MTEPFTGLILPTPEEVSYANATMRVSAIAAADYAGWEAILRDQSKSPIPHMRAQRQAQNDCAGQATANGEEKRGWWCTGKMFQLSDIYAYNASEYVSGARNVGRDQGTSIHSGVRLLTEGIKALDVAPGLPYESDWPYTTYERSAPKFASRAQQVTIDQSYVSQHGELPPFREMLIAMAAGGSGHIGTYWAPKWSKIGNFRLMDDPPRSGGGHATEIIWALDINGTWYLVVWNSHGDRFYLMSERCYEALRRNQFAPFGGYLLMPDKPVERYHTRIESGGGYY